MKILITGSEGFIGRNLAVALDARGYRDLLKADADTPAEQLERYCAACGFVYHLAGADLPKQPAEYMRGDFGVTDTLLRLLTKQKNRCPVMFASSTHAAQPSLYGRSKKAGEELLEAYARQTGVKVYIYRLPHVFGKWSSPSQNGVIAAFCYNISHDLPVAISDADKLLNLAYIDDITASLCDLLEDKAEREGPYCIAPVQYRAALGDIAARIRSFRDVRAGNALPDMSEPLTRKLYATYLSFLPVMEFAYPLEMREDENGSMTEFLRLSTGGRISVCVCKPGAAQAERWQDTKAEKLLVVSGTGVVKLRRADQDDEVTYPVSARRHVAIDIPAGYAHRIENTGRADLVALVWSSECRRGAQADAPDAETTRC